MPTNLPIHEEMIEEAMRLGGHRTRKDALNAALREYIQRRRQTKILELFGTIEFDRGYRWKTQRHRR
jgi:hypothetical protein